MELKEAIQAAALTFKDASTYLGEQDPYGDRNIWGTGLPLAHKATTKAASVLLWWVVEWLDNCPGEDDRIDFIEMLEHLGIKKVED